MIKLKDISYQYNEKYILEKLNISIAPESFHSIIGLSGAGKTLTLKILSRLKTIQEGSIENPPKSVGFVFQNAPFFTWLTILKNLEICTKMSIDEIRSYLKDFRLEAFADKYPAELSGGTLQKVNILRSFLNKPNLILMDEPFVHLDIIQKEELYEFTLDLWRRTQATILLVTHDINEALSLSTEISYLSSTKRSISDSFVIKTEEDRTNGYQKIYSLLKEDFKR